MNSENGEQDNLVVSISATSSPSESLISLILSLKKDMNAFGRAEAGKVVGRTVFYTFPNISFVNWKSTRLESASFILSQTWALLALSIRVFTNCLCLQYI